MHHHHHHHGHDHHHHHHDLELSDVNRALVFGIILNVIFVVIEVLAGLWYQSLALLSDAGHNFSDVIALVMALVAFKLLEIAPTEKYTYGYRKTTILAALVNGILLLLAVVMILWESLGRWIDPVPIDGQTTAIVAGIGILINGFTAWLFVKDKDKDLNLKGAYLHMLADTMVSAGVVISGLVIWGTNWYLIDTIMSLVIVVMIFLSTWSLFKESMTLILDGVPREIDFNAIKEKIETKNGVVTLHHMHIWALSTTENAMTAHIVVEATLGFEEITALKKDIKHVFLHENIAHITLETEREGEDCDEIECNHSTNDHHHHHHH